MPPSKPAHQQVPPLRAFQSHPCSLHCHPQIPGSREPPSESGGGVKVWGGAAAGQQGCGLVSHLDLLGFCSADQASHTEEYLRRIWEGELAGG